MWRPVVETTLVPALKMPGRKSRGVTLNVPSPRVLVVRRRPWLPRRVTSSRFSAGTTLPRKVARRPYRTRGGPPRVMPRAVNEMVFVTVSPSADRAVSVAVHRPAW